jgi:hypothetical protein
MRHLPCFSTQVYHETSILSHLMPFAEHFRPALGRALAESALSHLMLCENTLQQASGNRAIGVVAHDYKR